MPSYRTRKLTVAATEYDQVESECHDVLLASLKSVEAFESFLEKECKGDDGEYSHEAARSAALDVLFLYY